MPEFTFNPTLPDWIAPINQTQGRPSASTLSDLSNTPRERTLTVSAEGAMIPILYGEVNAPGLLFTQPTTLAGDLVVGFIWGIGEIEAIDAVYINDEVAPAGVTITNYTGTSTQGVDPTLAAALAGYNDTVRVGPDGNKRGIAYSVLRIPVGEIDGFPRVRADIRGRKVYDPRTDTVVFSDNPSLCFSDLCTDTFYGLGISTPKGLSDCADWNDSLLGGAVPRAKLSLQISRGRPIPDYLKLLGEYAEIWYTYEGTGITMIPDQIVDLNNVVTIDQSTIIEGSLSMSRSSSIDTPTEVEVRYTEPSGDATVWKTESVVRQLPGVEDGSVTRIPTTISLEGIYRLEEASNRALARLNRLQDQVQISWVSTDSGIVRQIGDVVKVNNINRGFNNIPVRIEKVNMTSYGRYAISGSMYSDEHYPSEIDTGDDGTVPVGVIGLLSGDTIPAGWSEFTDANNKYVICAGNTYSVGDTGGSATFSGFTGTTSNSGQHTGTGTFPVVKYIGGGVEIGKTVSNQPEPDHNHAYDTGTIFPEVYTRENVLVIKTGTPALSIPKEVISMGIDGIIDGNATRITNHSQRMLKANSVNNDSGKLNKNYFFNTNSTNDIHDHDNAQVVSDVTSVSDFANIAYGYLNAGSLHTHILSTELIRNLKRYNVAIYGGISDYSVKSGRIFLWSGSLASLPTDWYLCDGNNNTPDMTDCFIEFAGATSTGATGDNTLSLDGTTTSVGHSHKGSSFITYKETVDAIHNETEYHNHTITDSSTWQPEYYALAAIIYLPSD